MIAAIFVHSRGPYMNLPGVDAWDVKRNAMKYFGPHPAVAHPPCQRWGNYWFGSPSCGPRFKLGDDGGQFSHALAVVRCFGGVIEHPAHTKAFKHYGLGKPKREGGWQRSADGRGWICQVHQGWYDHPADKATWLYAVVPDGAALPELKWGKSPATRKIDGGSFHTAQERREAVARGWKRPTEVLSKKQRCLTYPAFQKLLIDIAKLAEVK